MTGLPTTGYLTVGISTQVPWPSRERVVVFQGREVQLLPGSETLARMVRVKTDPGFKQPDADKLILELLSALSWAEQAEVLPTFRNWSTRPISIGVGPTGGMTGTGHFDYLPSPQNPKAKLALALYREGISANLVPYQFLGFFKVINVIRDRGVDQMQWIQDNLQHIVELSASERITEIKGAESDVAGYLYRSGRCAVAHAFDESNVVNPDDPTDLRRLSEDLPVIRELARVAIQRELGVQSLVAFHEEHLYELEGFRALFGNRLVAAIKSGEAVRCCDIPLPRRISLRLRDREPIDLFEAMDAAVLFVRDGCVRLRLGSEYRRLVVFVTLDFMHESMRSDPLSDVQHFDDGTKEAAKMLLQWMQLHRFWFGANGVIELWDSKDAALLGRSQAYIPPVNSRFAHEEFDKQEAELRVRFSKPDRYR